MTNKNINNIAFLSKALEETQGDQLKALLLKMLRQVMDSEASSLCGAGYLFGNVAFVKNNLTAVIFAIIALSLLPLAIGWWKHRSAAAAVAAQKTS